MEDADEVQRKQRKLLYLESLRGIAAVVVILSHFANAFFPAAAINPTDPTHNAYEWWFHNTPLGIVLAGNFAVCLFFVMSGYVLVRPYFLAKRSEVLVSAAYRRYFRLMPPAALSVLIALLLMKLHLFTNQAVVPLSGSYHWLNALWNFPPSIKVALYQAFAGSFLANQVSFNPLLWTMTVEFLGSMLIFGVASVFGNQPKRWLVYAALAIIFARTYYLGFIVGMALADYFSAPGAVARIHVRERYLTLLLVTGLLLGAYPSDGYASISWYKSLVIPFLNSAQLISLWHTIGATFVVGSILIWTRAKSLLSHRSVVFLGRMSFSLYLTHLIILCTLGTELFVLLHTHMGYRLSVLVTSLVTFGVIFVVAYAYTRFVDEPSIRRARRIGAWLMDRTPGSPEDQPNGASAKRERGAGVSII